MHGWRHLLCYSGQGALGLHPVALLVKQQRGFGHDGRRGVSPGQTKGGDHRCSSRGRSSAVGGLYGARPLSYHGALVDTCTCRKGRCIACGFWHGDERGCGSLLLHGASGLLRPSRPQAACCPLWASADGHLTKGVALGGSGAIVLRHGDAYHHVKASAAAGAVEHNDAVQHSIGCMSVRAFVSQWRAQGQNNQPTASFLFFALQASSPDALPIS